MIRGEPTQHFVKSQRLRISYWDWGNEDAPLVVFVHGGRDHSRSWDRLVAELRDEYHVVALDLRGHGDSDYAVGSHYGLPDNALDLVRVIEAASGEKVAASRRAIVIGHSFGGAVTLVAAGTYPEYFGGIVNIEGTHSLVPREGRDGMRPEWLRAWGDRVRAFELEKPVVYQTFDAAVARMRQGNPQLDDDWLRHLSRYASRKIEGGYVWKYDWWVNARNSMEIRHDELPVFWQNIACPVLLLLSSSSTQRSSQREDAMTYFRDAQVLEVADSGHWIQHDQPERTLEAIRSLLERSNIH